VADTLDEPEEVTTLNSVTQNSSSESDKICETNVNNTINYTDTNNSLIECANTSNYSEPIIDNTDNNECVNTDIIDTNNTFRVYELRSQQNK
jgi:hypothetical protein